MIVRVMHSLSVSQRGISRRVGSGRPVLTAIAVLVNLNATAVNLVKDYVFR